MAIRFDDVAILLVVLILVAVIGFATQRGNVCSVLAARQIAETGATSRLRSFILASLWSLAVVAILAWSTGAVTPARTFSLDGLAMAGAVTYGIGTMLNGACVFGTAARILSGNLSFLATLAGVMIAGGVGSALGMPALRKPVGDSPLGEPSAAGAAVVAVAAAISLVAFARYVLGQRRAGRTWPRILSASRWSTSLAMPVIGVIGGVLLASGLPWNYPVLLRGLGSAMAGGGLTLPLIALVGPIAFVVGGIVAAASAGRARLRPPEWVQSTRSLVGGTIMGLAGFLIPGGNDVLLLAGVPSLSLHALAAYVAMLAVQIAVAFTATALKRRRR